MQTRKSFNPTIQSTFGHWLTPIDEFRKDKDHFSTQKLTWFTAAPFNRKVTFSAIAVLFLIWSLTLCLHITFYTYVLGVYVCVFTLNLCPS